MRKSLESFVTHRWFEKSMLFMIVLSSCLLAVDSPVEVDKDSRLKYWLDVSDVFFVGLFVLEAALKIVALGKRYFKNGWNVLGFLHRLARRGVRGDHRAGGRVGRKRRGRGEDPPSVSARFARCASRRDRRG
jgi:hypothetical protein